MTVKLALAMAVSAGVGAAAAVGGALYWPPMQNALASMSGAVAPADEEPSDERRILYWWDPMMPEYRSDKPGLSPMGMEMVPVYEGEEDEEPGVVRISPAVVNNMGVRTATATRGELSRRIDTVGYVDYDENRISHVHLRTDGWIERLAVKSLGAAVRKDQLLLELYSPTLVNAQAEFLQAHNSGQRGLVDASWRRLEALDVSRRQMEALAASGQVSRLVQINAPQSGIVADLAVAEGMYVEPATRVMTLADLSTVWLMVDVFERQADWVKVGLPAEVTLPSMPGRTWRGAVDYIYPQVDPTTRTLKLRLAFDNPDGLLKPNMYARVEVLSEPSSDTLSIPREALIRTGRSNRVIIALGEGRFRAEEVAPGIEAGERIEILSGLDEGDRVVVSGQFLIDSESSMTAGVMRMEAPADDPGPVSGVGIVNRISPEEGRINLSHEPIAALGWPEMTMDFGLADGLDLATVSVGQTVRFEFVQENGGYVVTAIAGGEDDAVVGEGVVNSVDFEAGKVNLTHEPIPAIGWPMMTMDFTVTEEVDLSAVAVGDTVRFELVRENGGAYLISSMTVIDP